MAKYILCSLISVLPFAVSAQRATYGPELLTGHRSFSYLHNVAFLLSDRMSVSNLTLFDTEYRSNTRNIFFIRNMLSYTLLPGLAVNAFVGVKNPGSFVGGALQYSYRKSTHALSYSAGATYQTDVTLEQSLRVEYYPRLSRQYRAYFNLLAIANINTSEYQRGLMYLRAGVKKNNLTYGVAFNLDQFNNNAQSLENAGSFIRVQF
jgi:hypothetical protein